MWWKLWPASNLSKPSFTCKFRNKDVGIANDQYKDKPFDVLEASDVVVSVKRPHFWNDNIACYYDAKLLQLKSAVKLQSCWIIGWKKPCWIQCNNVVRWYHRKKLDGLGSRINNQALITQVTTFLRLSPSFNHILDRFINIHSSVLSKRLGVLWPLYNFSQCSEMKS